MARISGSRLIVLSGVPTSAALLVLSTAVTQPRASGLLVLSACAGIGAAVAGLQTGKAWRRVLHGVLAVQSAFFALVLAWTGYWIVGHGRIPIRPQIVVPYVALIALHHAVLALGGGLAAVFIPPALRRARAVRVAGVLEQR